VVYAIYRRSAHWITNTARGAEPDLCPLTPDIVTLALSAARAVGEGILAVDLLEDADGRLLVSEVNHTPEFHGAMQVVDVDIAGKMADYVIQRAVEKHPHPEGHGGIQRTD
jgi:L-2-aminoadipate N-acetyltransferase (EC 2.3.1.-)